MSDRDREKRIDRIENKIDIIGHEIGGINVTLAKQHVTLKEHMKRTAQNEKLIRLLIVLAVAGGAEKLGLIEKLLSFLN